MSALRKKIYFASLISFILFLASAGKLNAVQCPGDPCIKTIECQDLYGGAAFCNQNICCINPVRPGQPVKSSLRELQEVSEKNALERKVSLETIIGGSYSPTDPTLGHPGIIEDIFNSGTTAMAGNVLISGRQGGAIAGITNLIALMYAQPPASGINYLADVGRSFGFTKTAYAQQGIGFRGLTPILPLWKMVRNLSYVFFIIVFVITGLAIMFRAKISPQAVLTLESALPKLIITLILITFSYAIVGLLIDLIYILIGIGVSLFREYLPSNLNLDYSNAKLIDLLKEYFGLAGGKGFATMLADSLGEAIYIPIISDIPVIGNKFEGALISFVLILALLFACFKLFFSLLSAYIGIIIAVITSPFILLASAIPGMEVKSFGNWIKDILANILVFPAVVIIFLLASAIKTLTANVEEPIWSPPFMSGFTAELAGGLIAYGLFILAPQVPSYIKAVFEPKTKTIPPGSALMGGVGAAIGPIGTFGNQLVGREMAFSRAWDDAKRLGKIYQKDDGSWVSKDDGKPLSPPSGISQGLSKIFK